MWMLANISKNKPFIIIMLLITIIQMLMIFYGGELFRSSPLSLQQIVMTVMLAFTLMPFDMIFRIFRKLKVKRT